jgi:regulator of nucleoside diphosphate kinase
MIAGGKSQRLCKETTVRDRHIVITESDASRLRGLLATRMGAVRDHGHLEELAAELERALIAGSDEVPGDVITMHTRVRVLDLKSREHRELVLVFPLESDPAAGRISVLAPLGTALLGYREGDEVEWTMPGGLRRLRIEKVWQPPAPPSATYRVAS